MNRRWRALRGLAVIAMLALAGADSGPSPPPELIKLERAVDLRVAHVRIEGPVDAPSRKLLSEAEQLDLKGEDALKAGDYAGARDLFNRANETLGRIGI
jgi:hypothetical protein